MSGIDFERVRAVFLAARDLDDTARADVMRRACAGDTELRAEVESLLTHHDAARAHPTTPVAGSAMEAMLDGVAVEATLPRPFGAFELLEVIGRGGMGTVYRARQSTPDRTVALKVIRPGMMTSTMLGRFRYEADVLARLRHPGIAQIFEAGSVERAGVDQPYFALELVSGRPIDLYALENDLDVRTRLAMLVKVCDAVHHAHQKGVIHRDLKPANILVDADGQPKVLDFGVARATDADVRATTLLTDVGQLVGTLPYMSPEQVSGDPRRLDVRSDVYALGILLFEILTGRLPYDLREKTIADAALTIRDADPARLGAIVPALRGDLDTITGKTLEKEPSRRYESAAALAEDLRRYLSHQPIIARPPSVTYQLRLFARRHRALVAGGGLAAAALVLATGISIGFAVRAQRAAEREARQRQLAERTNEHLEGVLMLPDPHRAGAELTVAEMLDLMIERLDAEDEFPEVEAEVRSTIGRTYLTLRQSHRAVEQLERAIELWREIDPNNRQLPEALLPLSAARFQLGDGEGGEAACREAIAILERHGEADLESARAGLVDMLVKRRRFAEAEPVARELLDDARRRDDPVLLISRLRQLTRIESGLGAHDAAEQNLTEASALVQRHLPETHPMVNGVLLDLSAVRQARGDLEGALEASTEAYDLAQRIGEPGSFDWMLCTNGHLALLGKLDRREEMIDVLMRARASFVSTFGPDHRFVRETNTQLARVYERWGQPEKAQAFLEAAEPAPTQATTRPEEAGSGDG